MNWRCNFTKRTSHIFLFPVKRTSISQQHQHNYFKVVHNLEKWGGGGWKVEHMKTFHKLALHIHTLLVSSVNSNSENKLIFTHENVKINK